MAEAEYFERYDGTYAIQRADQQWRPAFFTPTEVVDFNDPEQVTACLIDNGDYNGEQLMAAFSDKDVMDFALEDAERIIAARDRLLEGRENMRLELQAAMARAVTERQVRTVYVVHTSVAS